MKENVDIIEDDKTIRTESSDNSPKMFQENITEKDLDLDVKKSGTQLSSIMDNISNINPLRDVHNENKFTNKSKKIKQL